MIPTAFSPTSFRTVLLASIAGLACGCTSYTTQPTANRTNGSGMETKVVSNSPNSGMDSTANGSQPLNEPAFNTTMNNGENNGQTNGFSHGPSTKLEPFWISMVAEADRAVWDDQFNANKGMDVMAMSTAGTVPTHNRPMGGDAEGLSHVTFAAEGCDFDPCVSHDGRFIAFSSTQHRPSAAIYVKDVNGRTVTQLTGDPSQNVMPCFSPDGTRIAFCSNRNGNFDIFVMSRAGGQAAQLTNDATHELHPSWSPDGKKLAFCRKGATSGQWELWVMDVNGSGSSEFLGYGMYPQFCPVAGTGNEGSSKILFQRPRERGDRAFSLWTIDYRTGNTSSPTEIACSQGQACINGSWSPDGTRVVYATLANAGEGMTPSDKMPQTTLWMTGVDGTQRVMLTGGPFMNVMPTWCSDNRIYFVSDRTGQPNIWSIGTERALQAAGATPISTGNEFAGHEGETNGKIAVPGKSDE